MNRIALFQEFLKKKEMLLNFPLAEKLVEKKLRLYRGWAMQDLNLRPPAPEEKVKFLGIKKINKINNLEEPYRKP